MVEFCRTWQWFELDGCLMVFVIIIVRGFFVHLLHYDDYVIICDDVLT